MKPVNYLIFITLFAYSSCKNKSIFIENKKALFEFSNTTEDFSKYIYNGENMSEHILHLDNLKRKKIGLNDITNGVNGFEFAFQFSYKDTTAYYLVFGKNEIRSFSTLYQIIYNRKKIEEGQFPIDSINISPKSGWENFLRTLKLLRADKVLNEMDTALQREGRNFIWNPPMISIEFANKKEYRILRWNRGYVFVNEFENLVIDKLVKFLYDEFSLNKYMPTIWKDPPLYPKS